MDRPYSLNCPPALGLALCATLAAACGHGALDEPPVTSAPDAGQEPEPAEEPDIDAGPPARCDDGLRNGDESDVDCGGPCDPCPSGLSCERHEDCDTGACLPAGVCVTRSGCLELAQLGNTTDGVYRVAPIGEAPLDVYCDQTTDGGGWTLVMSVSAGDGRLRYDAPQWTTELLLDPEPLAPNLRPTDDREAKFEAFNVVRGDELRVTYLDPAVSLGLSSLAGRTTLELFQTGERRFGGSESACGVAELVNQPSFQPALMSLGQGHQFFGVNGEDTQVDTVEDQTFVTTRRMRFGLASNDDAGHAWVPRYGIGSDDAGLVWSPQIDCNECNGCYGVPVSRDETAANVWVR